MMLEMYYLILTKSSQFQKKRVVKITASKVEWAASTCIKVNWNASTLYAMKTVHLNTTLDFFTILIQFYGNGAVKVFCTQAGVTPSPIGIHFFTFPVCFTFEFTFG